MTRPATAKRVKPRAIDLFCGAGGLSEGLRQAGFNVIGAIDSDELACRTYALNHRRSKVWQVDIRKLRTTNVMEELGLERGELDLLAACPPCQGFSSMRTRNGNRRNRDPRNALINDVLRFVRSMRPAAVMLENVPGLERSSRYRDFRRGLEELGYKVRWKILNALDFAVPQRRQRLVLLAARAREPHFASPSPAQRTVREAIGALCAPSRSDDPVHNYRVARSEKVMNLIRQIPPNGGSRSALGGERQLRCHQAFDGFADVYGRMAWDKPAPTITTGCINPSRGRFLHPSAHRAITLREAALLQTFPPSYRFAWDNNRYALAVLIGNALPPEFIKRHARALRESTLAKKEP